MNTVALHNANIVLSICGTDIDTEKILDRLSRFYRVGVEFITQIRSPTIATYFIRGAKEVYGIDWQYEDTVSFSASAYPIPERTLLESKGRKEIKNIVTLSRGDLPDMYRMKPPFCYFHHHKINDTLICFNDFMGMGRLYTYSKNDVHIAGSSPIAIALAMPEDPAEDSNFWDCYQTHGGGIGSSTYFKDIELVQPGTKVSCSKGRMVNRDQYSYQRLLLLKRSGCFDDIDAIQAGSDVIDAIKGHLPENLKLGVSGGRDSRFIAALALKANLDFGAYTSVPPLLEAEIAKELFDVLDKEIYWEQLPHPTAANTPTQPILERAASWFEFTSGDCWSSFIKNDFTLAQREHGGHPGLSGASGEIARGHDYTLDCLGKDPFVRIEAMMRSRRNGRVMLPPAVKSNAVTQLKAELFQPLSAGIQGFHLLDYAFAMNRMRRQYPATGHAVTPILTAEMAIETFWMAPIDKLNATYIVDKTCEIVPEWRNVKYMHERSVGTDPNLTNKTMTVPTLWEIDKDDFMHSIDHVIDNFADLELDRGKVEQNIAQCPEGRPRTSQTYEFMFWRSGFLSTMNKVNSIRRDVRIAA